MDIDKLLDRDRRNTEFEACMCLTHVSALGQIKGGYLRHGVPDEVIDEAIIVSCVAASTARIARALNRAGAESARERPRRHCREGVPRNHPGRERLPRRERGRGQDAGRCAAQLNGAGFHDDILRET